MRILSATDSIFRRTAIGQTPGQQAAQEFLNSPDYWDLVDNGTHPEHRETWDEFPNYTEDYSVYPGDDEAGPAHDRDYESSSDEESYDHPEGEGLDENAVANAVRGAARAHAEAFGLGEDEQYLHHQLGQEGFTHRRAGEYGKTDEQGNWHTIMLPGDYRRARIMTTEFYNPRTEQTITHTHPNVDSILDRYDINHSYSQASAAGPVDYRTHFLNWVRQNPQSHTAQEWRQMQPGGRI